MSDKANASDQESGSLGHYLILAGIEAALNSTIAIDKATVDALIEHEGTVIRLKIRQPYMVCYLIVDSAGIEVRDEYPGHSDIRITTGLSTALRFLLGLPPLQPDYKVWGNAERIQIFRLIHQNFDVRTALSLWLRQHLNIPQLVQRIRDQDNRWLKDLSPIPELVRSTMLQIRHLNLQLEQQQQHLKNQEKRFRQQRLVNLLFLTLTGGLILSQSAHLMQSSVLSGLLLVVTGFVLARFTER